MSSKSENIQNAISAIDAKVAKLLHRKEELKSHQLDVLRAERAKRGKVGASSATSDGPRVSPTSSDRTRTESHEGTVGMLLRVLANTSSGNWDEDSLPPNVLARLSVTERQELSDAIRSHNSQL